MRRDTIRRKNATRVFRQMEGEAEVRDKLYRVLVDGKQAFDAFMLDMGRTLAESFLLHREGGEIGA